MKYSDIIEFFVVLCAAGLLLFSVCGCRKQFVAGENTTTVIKELIHDTTIVTRPDSASAVALLHCDSNYNIVLEDLSISEGERIRLETLLKQRPTSSGTHQKAEMLFDCKEDSLRHEIALRDKIISTTTERNIIEYKNTPFAKFCVWFFFLSLAAILVYVGFKIFARL